jgi:hypothetical protein
MSKSRNQKWYDYEDDDYSEKNRRKKDIDRRKQKRMKSALKTKDVRALSEHSDDY